MPITFTAVGSTLDVTIIDANFNGFEQLFKSGVVAADFLSTFSRFRVRRYVSGTLVAAHSFANPYRQQEDSLSTGIVERLDITYRAATENPGSYANVMPRIYEAGRHAYEMELLGKPGPSFYYSFQEDGLDPSVVLAGVTGWPPTLWPISRYPSEYCFSRWLTAPGASVRVYVPHPCTAKIHGMVKGDSAFFNKLLATRASVDPYHVALRDGRAWYLRRHGLVVDTNPVLYADEFLNANPNVIDPTTGSMATYCSWKIVDDITRMCSQRETVECWAEVALKGGRYYNFSMKTKDPCTHGWVNTGTNTWSENIWEWESGVAANSPSFTILPGAGHYDEDVFCPNFINLWENCSINVEFSYGRRTAYVTDTSHSDFSTKAP